MLSLVTILSALTLRPFFFRVLYINVATYLPIHREIGGLIRAPYKVLEMILHVVPHSPDVLHAASVHMV